MRESGQNFAGQAPRRKAIARAAKAGSAFLLVWFCGFASSPATADEIFEQNRTTYGDIGLIEVPSARMADDGQLAFSFGALEDSQRIGLGFQMLPWLETSFRYSHIPHFFDNGNQLYDRSFGIKVRLVEESPYFPAIAIGARDIVGTGVYGQEFIVASKRFWTVDFTAGLGWGRLASTQMFENPLGLIFSSFNTRSTNTGLGGTVDFGQLFHGPYTSLFGGFNWQTPIDGLDLLVEYSPDRYLQERRNTHFFTRMPVNVALSYRVLDNISLTGGYLYGTSWGGVISFHFDPMTAFFPEKLGTPPVPANIRTSEQREQSLTQLVDKNHEVVTLNAGGPWVNVGAAPTDIRQLLSAAPSSAARDYEIDGRTLAVNVEGPADMRAQCRIFAQIAATSISGVNTVAVADLSAANGQVTLCNVRDYERYADLHPAPDLAQQERTDAAGAFSIAQNDTAPSAGFAAGAGLTSSAAEIKIRQDAEIQRLDIDAVSVGTDTAIVYVQNDKYYFEAEAIGRIVRVLMADTPPNVEVFRVISLLRGIPIRETKVLRSDLERVLSNYGSSAEIASALTLAPAPLDNPILDKQQNDFPRFGWSIYPRLARSFFDPNAPARFGVFGDAEGYVDLWRGFTLEAVVEGAIYNNLGSNSVSNSLLPHVRSDFNLYYEHGANGISSFDATYRARLSRDVFAEFKGGYLEDMFMGAGGQVLWRPDGERWAIGIDAYQVWQRAFDRLFGAQHYNILTGHVSVYYETPWYGINVAVHGGRYLAGDWGGTLEISRRFQSGVEIGAFATFTNVPFSTFGEGSFDKGVIVRIPLEWMLPINTQSEANLDFRPLSRDGGQRLLNDDSLYDETRRTSYGEIYRHFDDIVSP